MARRKGFNVFRRFLAFVLLLCISVSMVVIFYYRLLFSPDGFIEWGNYFLLPLVPNGLFNGFHYVFWNAYSGDGMPNPFPSVSMVNGFFGPVAVRFLGYLLPFDMISKAYILLSVLFLWTSFYLFSGSYSKLVTARIISSIFFVYNPFQIDQLTAGDFQELWLQGILLLSLTFLIKARRSEKVINFQYALSAILLFITVGMLEFAYLGAAIYVLIFFAETPQLKRALLELRYATKRIFLPFVVQIGFVAVVFLPFILSAVYGSFISLAPSSTYAQPLSTFALFSNTFTSVLFLEPYPSVMGDVGIQSVLVYPHVIFYIWTGMLYAFLSFLLLWGFVSKKINMSVYSVFILVSALVGSGPKSIIPFVPIAFYEHFFGFQLLNASYYWDWVIIAPLYSVITIDVLNTIFGLDFSSITKVKRLSLEYLTKAKNGKVVSVIVTLLLLFVVVTPIASQGYYSTDGIINRGLYVPSGYNSLSSEIYNLTNGTYRGVAFFPPTQELNMSNHSPHFNNPLDNSQMFRSPYVTSYGSIPSNISNYFNFIYGEFYSNSTKNIAGLMGLAGVSYLVVLKDVRPYTTSSYSSNVSTLMNYQSGLKMIKNTDTFTIYLNKESTPVVKTAYNYTVLMGNYYSLNRISEFNKNLQNYTFFMPSDITAKDMRMIISNSSQVLLHDKSDLIWLDLLGTHYKMIHIGEIQNSSWRYLNSNYVPGISNITTAPGEFIFSTINSTGNIQLETSSKYDSIIMPVLFSRGGGIVNISVDGTLKNTIYTNTPGPSYFKYVHVKYNFTNKSLITITGKVSSSDSFVAIGNLYLSNQTAIRSNENYLNSLIQNKTIVVSSYTNSSLLQTHLVSKDDTFKVIYGGFEVGSPFSKTLVVNYPFYDNYYSNGNLVSSLGGVNELVELSQHQTSVYIKYNNFKYWLEGSSIQIFGILSYFVIPIVYNRSKYRKNRIKL